MKLLAFAARNYKEILRDPLNLIFGIGFPLVVLLLLSAIQANINVQLFSIDKITPGIVVFGLSFIAVFSGMLIAKDRETSFLMRLFTTPLSAKDYILGYTLPLLPIAALQIVVTYIAALLLGMTPSFDVLLSIVTLLPVAVLFIGVGLLAGSVLNDKQVSALCGAVLINLSAWLSGTWFDLSLVGGWFQGFAYMLPFAHAVDAGRAALVGDYGAILPHVWWVVGYAIIAVLIAVFAFRSKMIEK